MSRPVVPWAAVNPLWRVELLPSRLCARLRAQEGEPLRRNARLLAEALCWRWGGRVFFGEEGVLRALSPRRIERYALCWLTLTRAENPPPTLEGVTLAAQTLRRDWHTRLTHRLGAEAPPVYDRDLTAAAAHALLDAEERAARLCPDCRGAGEAACPSCGEPLPSEEGNAAFDQARFEQLSKGGQGE